MSPRQPQPLDHSTGDFARPVQTVVSQDLSTDGRWSRWSSRVVDDLGVIGMMSLTRNEPG